MYKIILTGALFFVSIIAVAQTTQLSTVSRGVPGDLWADIVIGQRDFTEINTNEIVSDKVFNTGGVVVDHSASVPGKAYIWDSNNNRILGIDLAVCYSKSPGTRCAGQIVIGQPLLNDYGACNHDSSSQGTSRISASNNSLCGVTDSAITLEEQRSQANMAVDPEGNLYVPDIENNRVLKYNNPFAPGSDTVADEVWGQDNFAGNECNKGGLPNTSTLCFDFEFWGSGGREKHGGVAIDPQGNLWVADTANNRVLRFPKLAGQIAKIADIVLGTDSMAKTASGGVGLNQLSYPTAITFDERGNLYVADSGNTRVLVFSPPFSFGMSGNTFGSNFAHNQPYSSNCDPSRGGYGGFYNGCDGNPWDVQVDPKGQGIWTYETMGWTSRIRLWSFSGTLLKSIDNVGTRGGGSLGLDKLGNVLVSVGFRSDVLRYQPQADGNYAHVQSFFSPPDGHNLFTNRRLRLTNEGGVATIGNQLAIADGRLLFWNDLGSLTNGKPADGYLRTGPNDNIQNATDFPSGNFFARIKSTQDKLWTGNRNKILIYQAPLQSGDVPVRTISSVEVLGGGVIDFTSDSTQGISGIAPDPTGDFLWITQTNSHRVLRIRGPLSSNPVVDIILGQPNLTSTNCNQSLASPQLNTLCNPGALSIDRQNNLYVSDHFHEASGNFRMLMFSSSMFSAAPFSLVTAPNATKEFPRSQGFATWEPAFDSTNRMVVGYNPYIKGTRRVDYFDNPTGLSTTPTGQFNDFNAWPVAITFDPQDNLYVYEANRGQVRIYKNPFNTDAQQKFPERSFSRIISGSILPSNQEPLSGVTVTLTNTTTQETKTTITDQQGNYSFSDLALGTYRLSPKKQDTSNTNISAIDAVLVLQGVVGVKTLTSEQKMIADVSGDGILSAVDAVMILQKKVELISRFVVSERCDSDWLFVPSAGDATTKTSPNASSAVCQNGTATVSLSASTPTIQDFAALQFGDVSGDILMPPF